MLQKHLQARSVKCATCPRCSWASVWRCVCALRKILRASGGKLRVHLHLREVSRPTGETSVKLVKPSDTPRLTISDYDRLKKSVNFM